MIFPSEMMALAQRLLENAKAKGEMIARAESCTSGLIAALLTEIPGSSKVFERGFLTYSDEAKIEMLGVRPKTLADHGAVSREVAAEMAEGALLYSHAHMALSVTGIAGPEGGSLDKPVGTVWFGLAGKGLETKTFLKEFGEQSREHIRMAAVSFGLEILKG